MALQIPQLNYLFFQLLSFPADSPDTITEEDVVFFEVVPTMLQYELISRDAVYQTGQSIFTDKFPIAPVRVTLDGNFGGVPRPLLGLTFNDGFARLKQMELLFRRSKIVDYQKFYDEYLVNQTNQLTMTDQQRLNAGQPNQKVYILNYYDFIFQEFFAVNLDRFRFYGNAMVNTKLQFYNLMFQSVGPLYQAPTTDPVLSSVLTAQALMKWAVDSVNSRLTALAGDSRVKAITRGYAAVQVALQAGQSILSIGQKLEAGVIQNAPGSSNNLLPIF